MLKPFLLALSLLVSSPALLAIPLAEFEGRSEAGFAIDNDTLQVSASSALFDQWLTESGAATGLPDGSGDASPVSDWFSAVSGETSAAGGFVDTGSMIDGTLTITNPGDTAADFTLSFSASLFSAIFTESASFDRALVTTGIRILDQLSNVVLEEFLSLDSNDLGQGSFSDSASPAAILGLSLAAGESIAFFLELDSSGLGQSSQRPAQPPGSVPEPASLLLLAAGLGALRLSRRALRG